MHFDFLKRGWGHLDGNIRDNGSGASFDTDLAFASMQSPQHPCDRVKFPEVHSQSLDRFDRYRIARRIASLGLCCSCSPAFKLTLWRDADSRPALRP